MIGIQHDILQQRHLVCAIVKNIFGVKFFHGVLD